MVIQYDKLPFNFRLTISNSSREIKFSDIDFCDDLSDIDKGICENQIRIKENWDVIVHFSCETDGNARLVMDGFDGLSMKQLIHTDGIYLSPSDKEVTVFSNEDFPLPPGEYIIKVSVGERTFFAGFEIISVRMAKDTWGQMSRDVLESINLMAFQMANRNIASTVNQSGVDRIGSLILKMNVINKEFVRVMAALEDIRTKPRSKISKTYLFTVKEGFYFNDFKANKLNSRMASGRGEYVPVKYNDYALAENSYVKHIVLELERLIHVFMEEINSKQDYYVEKIRNDRYGKDRKSVEYIRNKNTLEALEGYYVKAQKIKSAISRLKAEKWFADIPEIQGHIIPSQSMLDPRYGMLSRLSKELKSNTVKYDVDSRLSLLWKSSDKLYELWGTLKIVEALQNIGYTLERGLNVKRDGSMLKVSGLSAGDSFMLSHGSEYVIVSYDCELPKAKSDSNRLYKPVYTTSEKNKPDCRLDFYYNNGEEDLYMNSLVIDFKYRSKNAIWNSNENDNRSSKKQLLSYANDTRSAFISDYNELRSLRMRPVPEVWALYPDRNNVTNEQAEQDYSVRIISFVPGYEDVIEDCLRGYRESFVLPDIKEYCMANAPFMSMSV